MLTTTRNMPSDLAPSSANESATLLLRLLAICGVVAVCFGYQWSVQDRPDGEVFYTVVAAAAGVCLLRFVTPRATGLLLRHKDLLVPCGCYLFANEALALLPLQYSASFYLQPTMSPAIAMSALSLLAATLLISATFAVWQTLVIVQAVTSDGVDLLGELRHTLKLLPRGLGIVAVAYVAVQGPLVIGMWLGIMSMHALFMAFLFAWAIYALAIGIVTCLWLPLALDPDTPFWDSLREASLAGITNWQSNAKIIIPWALASGFITLRYISSYRFGHNNSQASWNMQPHWYGDYVLSSAWYTEAAVDNAPHLLWFGLPLVVLFTCVSIAVKITLIQRIDDHHPDAQHEDSDPDYATYEA
ncbi:MAG: hypothetical protein ACI89X_001648 [Planctomycetota bacterium]|jgi:hypothetical protein